MYVGWGGDNGVGKFTYPCYLLKYFSKVSVLKVDRTISVLVYRVCQKKSPAKMEIVLTDADILFASFTWVAQ